MTLKTPNPKWFRKNDDKKIGYNVINPKGEKVAGPYKTFKRASHKKDKLDDEYGGYHHRVKED